MKATKTLWHFSFAQKPERMELSNSLNGAFEQSMTVSDVDWKTGIYLHINDNHLMLITI